MSEITKRAGTLHRDGVYRITASLVDIDGKPHLRTEVTQIGEAETAEVLAAPVDVG